MTKFTLFVYQFFQRHRALFFAVMLASTLVFAWLSLKIEFEEDITKLLPPIENDQGTQTLAFANLKVKDMVFIQFYDRNGTTDTDTLTAICDAFVANLLAKDSVYHTINDVMSRIDEDLFQNAVGFLYENVPVFLDSTQYSLLDALLTSEAVDQQMAENYSLLVSAAGGEFQDIIVKDPIALRNLFLSGFGNSNPLGGSYAFVNQHIASSDSSVVVAFLAPNFQSFNSKQNLLLCSLVEDEIAHFRQQYPNVEILYHGAPVRGVYNSKRIKMDLLLTVSVSLALICILLLLCFKNKSTLLYLVAPVLYGIVFSMASIYLMKGAMSLMAVGIGAIIMGVAFSYVLHVLTHHKYINNPLQLLKDQTVPVCLGALTTIGAFMSLMLTESDLLKDFGLFASLGLAGTTVFSLLFLPQIFNLKSNRKSERAFVLLEKINSFPFEQQKWLIAVIAVVSVVCFLKSNLQDSFDSNLQNIGYHDSQVVQSEKLLAEKTIGVDSLTTIYLAAVSEHLDSALISAQRLCVRLDEAVREGYISGYTPSFSLFIPAFEQKRRIERWNTYWTADKKADIRRKVTEAAVKNKFAPNAFEPFFDILDAEYEPVSLYDAEIVPKQLLSSMIEFTDNRYMVFVPVAMNFNRLLESGGFITKTNPDVLVLDPMFYTTAMVNMIRDDFNIILLISSLFVLIVLLLAYRNITLSILAFLPMGLSWYIVLGMMALFGIKFNLINIIISSFIFGIGVDYSIFIMDGLLAKFRTREPLLIYHKTAIFFSAIILIIAVSSLLFAVHPAISSIGVATLIGMGATIVIAYSLQPFLFAQIISDRTNKGKAPLAFNRLLWFNKQAPVRDIKCNYLYKGYAVESRLNRALKRTKNYALLAEIIAHKQHLLDYGCGAGFCSYYAASVNPKMHITGFDSRSVALADNCYRKTDRMRFTTDSASLGEDYDVLILQSLPDATVLVDLLKHAKAVLLYKKYLPDVKPHLQRAGLEETGQDELFIACQLNEKVHTL
ncbi:MAG: MMPL family transporter [Bacteroidales bacterium]|nr:MMPL family transporter [Bacteroidales bacterium]